LQYPIKIRSLLAPKEEEEKEEEMSDRKNKRQRVDEEGEQADGKSGVDVRLSEELRGLLGGVLRSSRFFAM